MAADGEHDSERGAPSLSRRRKDRVASCRTKLWHRWVTLALEAEDDDKGRRNVVEEVRMHLRQELVSIRGWMDVFKSAISEARVLTTKDVKEFVRNRDLSERLRDVCQEFVSIDGLMADIKSEASEAVLLNTTDTKEFVRNRDLDEMLQGLSQGCQQTYAFDNVVNDIEILQEKVWGLCSGLQILTAKVSTLEAKLQHIKTQLRGHSDSTVSEIDKDEEIVEDFRAHVKVCIPVHFEGLRARRELNGLRRLPDRLGQPQGEVGDPGAKEVLLIHTASIVPLPFAGLLVVSAAPWVTAISGLGSRAHECFVRAGRFFVVFALLYGFRGVFGSSFLHVAVVCPGLTALLSDFRSHATSSG